MSEEQQASLIENARTLGNDLLLGEFIAATNMNEEAGELIEDFGRLAKVLQAHGTRQLGIAERYIRDLQNVRTLEQWFATNLHLARTTADNQLALLADVARLQAAGIAQTRHIAAVSFAALERVLAGGRARSKPSP